MIIKLYKSNNKWYFDYKQERHLVQDLDDILNAITKLMNRSYFYVRFGYRDKEVFGYINYWSDSQIHLSGYNLYNFLNIIGFKKFSPFGVIFKISNMVPIDKCIRIIEIR